MKRTVEIRIVSMAKAGQKIVDAWKKTERGEAVSEPRETLDFDSIKAMQHTLTPSRWVVARRTPSRRAVGHPQADTATRAGCEKCLYGRSKTQGPRPRGGH